MRSARFAWFGLVALSGCEPDTVRFFPDILGPETAFEPQVTWTGDLELVDRSVEFGCNPAGTAMVLSVETLGDASGGQVSIFGFTRWSETHPLLLEEISAQGHLYSVGPLLESTPEAEFVVGSRTLFSCVDDDPMAIIELFGLDGGLADCIHTGGWSQEGDRVVQELWTTRGIDCRYVWSGSEE